jgi:hypothetical protein
LCDCPFPKAKIFFDLEIPPNISFAWLRKGEAQEVGKDRNVKRAVDLG